MPRADLVMPSRDGPFCEAGGFHIDPGRRVRRAVITHAHSDHARPGCGAYLCSESCVPLLRERMGTRARIEGMPFGETRVINGVSVSFHPAGHVLGSAQVRLEYQGEVWVLSGDYKLDPDPSCEPFEPVRCDTFVTESTFGLPIYRWPDAGGILRDMLAWWTANAAAGRATVLPAYPLGKTQRMLAGLLAAGPLPGPVGVMGNGAHMCQIYRDAGRPLPEFTEVTPANIGQLRGSGLLIASSCSEVESLPALGEFETGYASGWMRVRKMRRWRGAGKTFTLSDHADWPGLLQAVELTGASRVGVTHGYAAQFARYLRETGRNAFVFPSHFKGEAAETVADDEADPQAALDFGSGGADAGGSEQ